jgi:hypothetical protein
MILWMHITKKIEELQKENTASMIYSLYLAAIQTLPR